MSESKQIIGGKAVYIYKLLFYIIGLDIICY